MQLVRFEPESELRQNRRTLAVVEPDEITSERVVKDLEPVIEPETREIFQRLPEYKWHSRLNRFNAWEEFKGLALSHYQGLPDKRAEHEKGFILHSNLDLSQKLVPIIARSGSDTTKLFAITEGVKGGDGAAIGGADFDWKLSQLKSPGDLPKQALRIQDRLKSMGLVFPEYYLAKPNGSKQEDFRAVIAQESRLTADKMVATGRKVAVSLGRTVARIRQELEKMEQERQERLRKEREEWQKMQASKPRVNLDPYRQSTERESLFHVPFYHRDPVLLGCFGKAYRFYIELCRWE